MATPIRSEALFNQKKINVWKTESCGKKEPYRQKNGQNIYM